jgi:hypothetical protein
MEQAHWSEAWKLLSDDLVSTTPTAILIINNYVQQKDTNRQASDDMHLGSKKDWT